MSQKDNKYTIKELSRPFKSQTETNTQDETNDI